MDKSEVKDTMEAGNLYLERLKVLQKNIERAEKQIQNTSHETESKINETFDHLVHKFIKEMNIRKKHLLEKTKEIETKSLGPIKQCSNFISGKIEVTTKLLEKCTTVLNNEAQKLDDINFITQNSSLLGVLPQVPDIKEVPYIQFHYESNIPLKIHKICSNFGHIFKRSPVQICKLLEKPGAIFVEWKVEELSEKSVDIHEFRLQRANGDFVNDIQFSVENFSDCYRGVETQYLCKDICVGEYYSFRITCKLEGSDDWLPWSPVQVARSKFTAFSWRSNQDYILLNDSKIAKPIKDNATILFSDGPQFKVWDSVEFTFLEADEKSNAVLGIFKEDNIKDFKSCTNALTIDQNGQITLDGSKKSTQLPKFGKDLKIIFTSERVKDDKAIFHIDSNEKRVTYEWNIVKGTKFYFAAQFSSTDWKIMVE